tara:strand:+ start:1216 stop:1980 length:765 start_codon:yes stop_codon:yes gene_type:complete
MKLKYNKKNTLKIIALIPARGGSKGVKLKNLHLLGNKPLINWTIQAAKKENIFDRIYVSSENKKILSLAKKNKINIHDRPKSFAGDKTTIFKTVRNFNKFLEKNRFKPDIIFVLEPTSPFRKEGILKKCLKIMLRKKLDSLATFVKSKTHPYRIWKIKGENPSTYLKIKNYESWTPRQSLSNAYELDGTVYAFRNNKKFLKSKCFIFGKSYGLILNKKDNFDLTGTEIDIKNDFEIAQIALKKSTKKEKKAYGL